MLPKHRSPTHPGEMLEEEFLKPMGVTQTALANHLEWSHAKVNELIRGKRQEDQERSVDTRKKAA